MPLLPASGIILELNGRIFADLSLALRLKIKRSYVRAVVIKKQSAPALRYSMFKRLNTGGEPLSGQEVRNCQARMLGAKGVEFYDFLKQCAANQDFQKCTTLMADSVRDKRGDEELVLRFLALKNAMDLFKGNVQDWLDRYLDEVILGKRPFEYHVESGDFARLFAFLHAAMGEHAFVKYKNDQPVGNVAPAYFKAVALGTYKVLDRVQGKDQAMAKKAIIAAVQSNEFRDNVGPGASTMPKLTKRVEIISQALLES